MIKKSLPPLVDLDEFSKFSIGIREDINENDYSKALFIVKFLIIPKHHVYRIFYKKRTSESLEKGFYSIDSIIKSTGKRYHDPDHRLSDLVFTPEANPSTKEILTDSVLQGIYSNKNVVKTIKLSDCYFGVFDNGFNNLFNCDTSLNKNHFVTSRNKPMFLTPCSGRFTYTSILTNPIIKAINDAKPYILFLDPFMIQIKEDNFYLVPYD